MKIATHIFTIYMLALALVPCGDGEGGIMEVLNHIFGTEHQHISDHEQHSNNCGDDICSLFCVCSCCSPAIDAPEKLLFQMASPPPIPSRIPSFLPNIISSSFYTSIWQPPKLS